MSDWMELIPQRIFPKRRSKYPCDMYREEKQARHKTRGGKGVVARLMRRRVK